jgi:glutathione synthase/RimK-type ligase-like ATP-grasp enzyme
MSTAKLIVTPESSHTTEQLLEANEEIPPEAPRARSGNLRSSAVGDYLLVVENSMDWQPHASNERTIDATEYLGSGFGNVSPGATVINLCRSHKYLSVGYYCSLLAEARGQRVFPSIKTINDLSRRAIYSLDTDDLDVTLNAILGSQNEHPMPVEFSLDIYFGATDYTPLAELARQIFETFPVPLMRVEFERGDDWHISSIKIQNITALNDRQGDLLAKALQSFNHRIKLDAGPTKKHRHHVAILHNPEEALPPSNQRALNKFVQVGRELGMQVSLIEKNDFSHLAEYDALFIRETTAINHHTYLFAKKAESEGLVVIDDPISILRCTNKVYLADLMRLNRIATPRSYVLQRSDIEDISQLEREIAYPMVMKVPDGAFSRGVSKAANRAEFQHTAQDLLKHSSLILVQEYLYTEFDWRIGVLNRQAIFASQYFMSKGHWQVAKRDASGKAEFGMGCSVPLNAVPPDLLDLAVRAANLIGDSLYGVDMKMTANGPVLIEVNDNPNLDVGIEDSVLGDELYRIVLRDLARRIELKHDQAGSKIFH